MRISLPLLPKLKCNFHYSTLIAAGSGLGAATGCGLLPWYYLLPPGFLLLTLKGRQLAAITIAFLLCFISGIGQTGFAETQHPLQSSIIQGELLCIDRKTTGVESLPPIRMPQCLIRTSEGEFEVRVAGHPENYSLFYGEKFYFRGVLSPAQPAGLICNNGEITGEIPPVFGDTPLLYIREMTPDKKPFSLLRPFLQCRDILLRHLVSGIRDPEIAEMSALLFFGASNGASSEKKQNFIAAGIIHLFSVSGLHVTLIAGIILLFLRPIPFRYRYWLAAIFTLFYVLCSGASLPAVRAGSMIILWCIMRSCLYPSASWNALMFTWSIFALIAPETVGSLSAQYSFGITAALLLLIERTAGYNAGQQRKTVALMPSQADLTQKYIHKTAGMKKLLLIPAVTLTAFAAGAGIALYRQNIFTPGSIAGNLMLVLMTPLLFGTMIFKMSAGALFPIANNFGAYMLEAAFYLLSDLTGGIADLFAPVYSPPPPLWAVALFYLLFFGTLGLKSAFFRKICASLAVMLCIAGVMFMPRLPGKITVISHGSQQVPMVVFYERGVCRIINIPDHPSAVVAGKLLRQQGVTSADVLLSSGVKSCCAGLPVLSRRMELTVQYPQFRKKPTAAFRQTIKESNAFDPEIAAGLKVIQENNTIIYHCGNWEISSRIADNGRIIEVKGNGISEKTVIPWCSLPVVWECQVK